MDYNGGVVSVLVTGIMSLAGYPIPGEVYAWTIVFVLPVNSALNPILYTVAAVNWKVTSPL